MSNSVLWAGPRLLVPITVEALVVTDANNATQFSIQPLQLGNYNNYGAINPNMFVSTGKPAKGVYLNWALPDGLTHGIKQKGQSQIKYPYLPNRWMIVRFSADANVPRKAWIVESDWFSGTPGSRLATSVASKYITKDSTGAAQIYTIGQVYDFATWAEHGQSAAPFLTAVGNSDPLFTAYAGNNSYVFSFTDPFTDSVATEVSYMVCGWYSNTVADTLYAPPATAPAGTPPAAVDETNWLNLMSQLKWSVGDEAIDKNTDLANAVTAAQNWLQAQGITPITGWKGIYAAQTLCHGMVLNVTWPGDSVEPPSSVPVFNTGSLSVPYVSAGNAATDCMAAFMQWQLNYNNPNHGGGYNPDDQNVEMMLEAFAHKMLPQPGGVIDTPELMDAIHTSWFGHLPGGSVWVAQAPQTNGDLTQNNQPPAALTPDLATSLSNLNTLQRTYDKNLRVLSSLQKQLYADWMKVNILTHTKPAPPSSLITTCKAAQTASLKAVQAQQAQVSSSLTAVNNAAATFKNALNMAGNMVLINKPGNEFFNPTDPVFLINNVHRSSKRGMDITYSKDNDSLFVRFTGQLINSLLVQTSTTASVKVNASDICPTFNIGTSLVPKEIPGLLAEAYMLDMNFAQAIAVKATGQASPPASIINTIKQQQTLVWNADLDSSLDKRTLEQISGFNPGDSLFHVPSKIGVWQWQQPWNPLYMEWQINFYPALGANSASPDLSQWSFNGADYQWTGGTIPPAGATPYTFSGRSILTPKEAVTLQAQLKEFFNQFKGTVPHDYISLQDVMNGVGDWDVLSQKLTGFTTQLLQWNIQQFGYSATDATFSAAIGDAGMGMPSALNNAPFFPVRAGFVSITNLWIVDDFGQVYNLNPASSGGGVPNPMTPIPGIGVEPGNYALSLQLPGYFQLPPRVIQPSRLNFNFVSAASDAILSDQDPATSPVTGWVLPNHIDDSIAVYDNNGQILGELALMGATGTQHAQWVPAPLIGVPSAQIGNLHLRGFVQGLLGTTASDQGTAWSGQALTNFMQVVDETLWSVDPMGERDNQSLSILVGRPIAVLRASMQLELYGNPATNLSWAQTGLNNNGGIANYQFPVQLGNIELAQDGVMGYFLGDNYNQFNSVHNGEVVTPASPAYVVNNFTNLQFMAAQPTYITLLLDPRGAIHTSSGILPVLKTILPEIYVGNALNNMLVEFETGPLILDTKTWNMPLPAGAGLEWSWLQPSQNTSQLAWTEIPGLVSATSAAQLPLNAPSIMEGRLKLAGSLGSQPAIYFFQVNGVAQPTVKVGTVLQLSWAAQGTAATLTIGSAAPVTVSLNNGNYSYTASTTQTLTLTVTGANGATTPPAKLTITVA